MFEEDHAIIAGLAQLGEMAVMVIGQQKGHTTSELVEHNFGMPEPEGYRKSMRLMRYAARFGLPLVTIVDTPGAYPGLGAEERGQSNAIAESIMLMSRLPVPAVTVVTGEGGSGGALAIAAGDRVLMMENAYYSVISPEGCSTILFKDASAAPRAAKALRITSPELLRLGVMDAVVPEPEGGAQTDPSAAGANLKAAIVATLGELLPLSTDELIAQRYERFRKFGTPGRQPTLPPYHRGDMSENENTQATPDRELIESVWAEARDLIKRLEGSTVQRFAVAAGDYKIEIERGSPPAAQGMPECPLSSSSHLLPADLSPPARAPA